MRKTLILCVLICAAAVGGFAQTKKKLTKFKKKPVPASVKNAPVGSTTKNMNGQMTLALKQTATDNASGISLEFIEMVNDSRCPEDVRCIWAGNAKIKISVSKNGAAGQTIELNTNLQPHAVVYQGYSISLENLSPYPKSSANTSASDYRADLKITKGTISDSADK